MTSSRQTCCAENRTGADNYISGSLEKIFFVCHKNPPRKGFLRLHPAWSKKKNALCISSVIQNERSSFHEEIKIFQRIIPS
jgi:hypothetical protein